MSATQRLGTGRSSEFVDSGGGGGGGSSTAILGWGADTAGATVSLRRWGNGDSVNETVDNGDARIEVPVAGTLKNLFIRKLGGSGASVTHTLTVRVNGVDTTIIAAVFGISGSDSDTVNTFAVSAGDLIEIKHTQDIGSAGAQPMVAEMELESTVGSGVNSKAILAWGGNLSAAVDTPRFYHRWSAGQNPDTTDPSGAEDASKEIIVPFSGTLKNLYVESGAGTLTGSTIRVNAVATTLTIASIPGGVGSDLVNSVAVNAGDKVSFVATNANLASGPITVTLELDSNGAQETSPSADSVTGSGSTTSGSMVLVPGLTITPGAGSYLVTYTGQYSIDTGGAGTRTCAIQIFANGSGVGQTHNSQEETLLRGFAVTTKVTVAAGQAIEGRFSQPSLNTTANVSVGTLSIVKVS
jgi:hypothetical protein